LGIDRMNNEVGYIITNVVPCCKICNWCKSNLTIQEFREWINKVYRNMGNQ